MAVRQQQRRGTAAQWTSANPILSPGEIGFEIDTNKFKIGDGTNRWAALTYFTADAAAALEDLIDGAPGLLNTLNELAAAVGDDANFFATVTSNIATAKSEAISTASSDATAKVSAEAALRVSGDAASVSTASADATTKANAAQAAAISAAATDATSKANAALASANTYTDGAVSALVDSAPELLNTLNELAAALGDSPDTIANLTTLVGTKADTSYVDSEISDLDTAAQGYASAAQSAAVSTASSDATTKANAAEAAAISAAATDATAKANAAKSGAESTAANALASHEGDTTGVHGIADTAALATKTYADSAVSSAVSALTKSSVGLGNVDNTSDANKPISTATQSALDLKAPLASPELTGVPTAPTASLGADTTQVATTAFVKAAIQDISSLNIILDGGGV